MEAQKALDRALGAFERRLEAVGGQAWHDETPCTEWDVRELVEHVAGEVAWIPPLLTGQTIEEVGDSLDGDLLGDDPLDAWRRLAGQARDAASDLGALERTVQLSSGPATGRDYLGEVATDITVHTWDLARAVGADELLDPELVAHALEFFRARVADWREAGVVGPALAVPADASDQVRLLGLLGRVADPVVGVVDRFNDAVNRQDRDAIADLLAPDCVFEDTRPPDGEWYEGRAAVVEFFDRLFVGAHRRSFTAEERLVAGDGVVVRWRHDWVDPEGQSGHVRGVDLLRVRNGQITEKRSYVKG